MVNKLEDFWWRIGILVQIFEGWWKWQDILFINPLGWDRYIWTRVLEDMPNQTFDFIEFTEESFKSISKKENRDWAVK